LVKLKCDVETSEESPDENVYNVGMIVIKQCRRTMLMGLGEK
jgi:hypothetical protein